jgi:hypothetical protein
MYYFLIVLKGAEEHLRALTGLLTLHSLKSPRYLKLLKVSPCFISSILQIFYCFV